MDEIESLRDFRRNIAPDTATAKRNARTLLDERMRRQPRDQRRWLLWGGVPATIGAVALVAIIAFNPFAGQQPQASAAAAQLNAFASIAALTQAPAPLADGQYAYTRSEIAWSMGTDGGWAIVPRTREIWIGADGSGRIAESISGEPIWLERPDGELEDLLLDHATINESFGPGELFLSDVGFGLTPERMAELSVNPDALAEMVRARAGQVDNPLDYQSFVVVGDLLRESNLSPAFRAAVYQVAARIPNVVLVGEVIDSSGRPGIAVAMDYRGVRHELVFDAGTAGLLEERNIVVSSDSDYPAEPGTVVGRATYLISGIVPSTVETP